MTAPSRPRCATQDAYVEELVAVDVSMRCGRTSKRCAWCEHHTPGSAARVLLAAIPGSQGMGRARACCPAAVQKQPGVAASSIQAALLGANAHAKRRRLAVRS